MLLGKKVRLRAVERDDLPLITSWFNDTVVRATIASYRPMSLADEQRWYEAMLQSSTDQVFVIDRVDPSVARSIGMCGIHKIDWKNRGCVVGIVIGGADDRGKGFGTDAMRALVGYAHKELGLERVELECFEHNVAGVKSYAKLGFVVDGKRRHGYFRDGRFQDLLLMSCLPGELTPG